MKNNLKKIFNILFMPKLAVRIAKILYELKIPYIFLEFSWKYTKIRVDEYTLVISEDLFIEIEEDNAEVYTCYDIADDNLDSLFFQLGSLFKELKLT